MPTSIPVSESKLICNMVTADGYLVPNSEFSANTDGRADTRKFIARLSLPRSNPLEIPTFGPKSEGASTRGRALDISELDGTPYATNRR